jgi:hypothetical protein
MFMDMAFEQFDVAELTGIYSYKYIHICTGTYAYLYVCPYTYTDVCNYVFIHA